MSCGWIVPSWVQCCTGGGAESSQHEAESPFLSYLTDYQRVGVGMFCDVHSRCGEIEVWPTWNASLTVLEEVLVSCPSCGEGRSYTVEGGVKIV